MSYDFNRVIHIPPRLGTQMRTVSETESGRKKLLRDDLYVNVVSLNLNIYALCVKG